MRKQTTLAASVAQASMITPRRSYRTRSRRRPLSQLIVRSTTQRTFPSPLPWAVFRLVKSRYDPETAGFRPGIPRLRATANRKARPIFTLSKGLTLCPAIL